MYVWYTITISQNFLITMVYLILQGVLTCDVGIPHHFEQPFYLHDLGTTQRLNKNFSLAMLVYHPKTPFSPFNNFYRGNFKKIFPDGAYFRPAILWTSCPQKHEKSLWTKCPQALHLMNAYDVINFEYLFFTALHSINYQPHIRIIIRFYFIFNYFIDAKAFISIVNRNKIFTYNNYTLWINITVHSFHIISY